MTHSSAADDWDFSLTRNYDTSGPRYTSYPTANLFHSGFRESHYRDLANEAADSSSITPLSLYLHIPFCRDICYYCACNKIVTRKRDQVDAYLDAMANELAMRGALHGHRPVTQLHWGGGTPTYLNEAELTELMHHVASNFRTSDDENREYSIEIDPRTVDQSTLALLKGLGFNRISMGVQDFDPHVQQSINRMQSFQSVAKLVQQCRDLKFSSLSFDLIYGLPQQTVRSFEKTLQRVVELAPNRIALYNYAHLPERFPSQRAIDRQRLPDASEKLNILSLAGRYLLTAGYEYIGMDHFVLPDDELARARRQHKLQRNFQGYSTSLAADLIGIGPSAISRYRDTFSQNARELPQWLATVESGHLPIVRGFRMSDEDKLREQVIMSIACQLEVDFASIERRFQINFHDKFGESLQQLKRFEDDGLVQLTEDTLRITPRGRIALRNICMLFDEYLEPATATRQFSRTL